MSQQKPRYPSKQKNPTPATPVPTPAPVTRPDPVEPARQTEAPPTEEWLSRSQQDLLLAESLVTGAAGLEGEGYRIYGGLCHSFPVLVQTCGLCQALAFHKSKAAGDGDRAKAHGLLLTHVGQLLGKCDDPLSVIRTCPVGEYMHHTRRVLSAWIYFKRFAVSILKVENSQLAEEGDDHV